jgi:hypothetical protein
MSQLINVNVTPASWCYSQNERFHGQCDTRDEAIEEGREFYGDEPFSIARVVHAMDRVNGCSDVVLENLELQIFDLTGFEEQIIELSKPDREALDKLIKDFVKDHATFSTHCVTAIEEIQPLGPAD